MKYIKLFEEITDVTIWYHGGNLDSHKSIKKGRWEYATGLYLTDSIDFAMKYAKGNRKLYKISIENGIDLNDSFFDKNKCIEFLKSHGIKIKIKPFIELINTNSINGLIRASLFNNMIINKDLVTSSKANELQKFYINNGIDYLIIHNAFMDNVEMMVLFNMRKMMHFKHIKYNDK